MVGYQEFYGTASWDEADRLMSEGYDLGAQKLMQKVLAIHNKSNSRKTFASVCGFAPIVPNAIRGVPKTMYATRIEQKKVPTRKVFIVNTAGNQISSDDLLESGAVMLNVCNQLERNGIRTEIYSIPKFSYSVMRNKVSYTMGCSIKIKNYREAFSFKKMAYMLAHTSMFRRHGFRYMETAGCSVTFKNRFPRNYGISFARDQFVTVDKLKTMGIAGENDLVLTWDLVSECKFELEKVINTLGLKK